MKTSLLDKVTELPYRLNFSLAQAVLWLGNWLIRSSNRLLGHRCTHAEQELGYGKPADGGDEVDKMATDCVMQLMELFAAQHHSGMSAPFVLHQFSTLAMHGALSPLTGEESEWVEMRVDEEGTPHFQNNRMLGVFKEGKNGQPYFIDAITFRDPDGCTFGGHTEVLNSSLPIESFPWLPKSHPIVDVDTNGKPLSEVPKYAPNAYIEQ